MSHADSLLHGGIQADVNSSRSWRAATNYWGYDLPSTAFMVVGIDGTTGPVTDPFSSLSAPGKLPSPDRQAANIHDSATDREVFPPPDLSSNAPYSPADARESTSLFPLATPLQPPLMDASDPRSIDRFCEVQASLSSSNKVYRESSFRPPNRDTPSLDTQILNSRCTDYETYYLEQSYGQFQYMFDQTRTPDEFHFDCATADRAVGTAEETLRPHAVKEVKQVKDELELEDVDDGQAELKPANIKKKRRPRTTALVPRVSKAHNNRPGRKFEMQWRIGQAPSMAVKEAKEQNHLAAVLAATSNYYRGNADGRWKQRLLQKAGKFDGEILTETFAMSVMLAAAFIADGQPANASQILHRTLRVSPTFLLNQHPQLQYYFIEMSMDSSPTVPGNVRQAVRAFLSPVTVRLLGEQHPLSILLKTPLTKEQRVRLRSELQEVVHQEHVRAFGKHSYQTMLHWWYWARATAAAGKVQESLRMLDELTRASEEAYSTNSVVAITALVERARVMISTGEPSVMVECLLSDALRRVEVLNSGQLPEPQFMDTAEVRPRQHKVVFPHLAASRTLARLHVRRWNFAAATYYLERALAVAERELTERSSLWKLCKTDLDATRMLDLEMAAGALSLKEDPTGRLPPYYSIIPCAPSDIPRGLDWPQF